MALPTVLEKLEIKDEKNILVQGLPSSIEKQFAKLNFAKSVTPLLKSRRIDLAVVFAISKNQLIGILNDVIPAMHDSGKLWVAYPKVTAKISSDLCRDCEWDIMSDFGFETISLVTLDNTWRAIHFQKRTAEMEFQSNIQSAKVNIAESLKQVIHSNEIMESLIDAIPRESKKQSSLRSAKTVS